MYANGVLITSILDGQGENKEKVLADYDAGMVVLVEKEYYHEAGMDFEIEYYSDGSTRDLCYGYCD